MKSVWKWVVLLIVLLLELLVWSYPYQQDLGVPFRSLWKAEAGSPESSPGAGSNAGMPEMEQGGDIGNDGREGGTSLPGSSKDPNPAQPGGEPSQGVQDDAAGSLNPKGEVGYSDAPRPAVDTGLLILVNKEFYLDRGYVPADLAPIHYYAADRSPESRYMRAEAADQFNRMAEAAAADGLEIVMTTAYRSYGFQSILYNSYAEKHGIEEADRFSARPGHSEHQTGLAVDVSAPSVNYALTVDFENTPEWDWLMEHAGSYGFILRYPKGKSGITGYMYEPWHFRYVGKEAALAIKSAGLTLEEYLSSENE